MGCTNSTDAAARRQMGSGDGLDEAPTEMIGEVVAGAGLSHPAPWRHGEAITRYELNQKREEFYHTRTDGSAVIWQNIKFAAEALLAGDEVLCKTIIEASNMKCPTGTLDLFYDELGHAYKVPRYLFSNPMDMVEGKMGATGAPLSGVKKVPLSVVSCPTTVRMQVAPLEKTYEVRLDLTSTILELKEALNTHLKESAAGKASTNTKEDEDRSATAAAAAAAGGGGGGDGGKVVERGNGLEPSELPVWRQRVVYQGKELSDSMRISQAGVDPNFVMQVYLRPKQA